MGKFLLPILLSVPALVAGTPAPARAVAELIAQFSQCYAALEIPEFGPDYAANFKAIPDRATTERRLRTLASLRQAMVDAGRRPLDPESRQALLTLRFFYDTALERLALERDFRASGAPVPTGGLAALKDRDRWYRLYARYSASRPIQAREVRALGAAEVRRVTAEISRLQGVLGLGKAPGAFQAKLAGPDQWFTDAPAVQAAFEQIRARVLVHLDQVLPPSPMKALRIAPIPNPGPDAPPAAYDQGTFYFGFTGGRYNRRALDWAFLHEAIPGHHYQTARTDSLPLAAPLQDRFAVPGFTEGWGAYAEDLGKDLGLYATPESELGKWEWDLVRSARLVLDVGIHVQGWSRERCLAYWRATLPNQLDLADRELDRITRWPAQVICYKVGEQTFLRLRAAARRRQGQAFNLKAFHQSLLDRGPLPLAVLEALAAPPRRPAEAPAGRSTGKRSA